MLVDDFDYELPEQSIAQRPVEPRSAARLLVDPALSPAGPDPLGAPVDSTVANLAEFLQPGDVVVVNNTRVLPARLRVRRPGGGHGELLLLEPLDPAQGDRQRWEALARPSRKMPAGTRLEPARAGGGELHVVMGADRGGGRREVDLVLASDPQRPDRDFRERLLRVLDTVGEMPLPPYLHEGLADSERYQTVYSLRPASAAAPTAGLHLTDAVLASVRGAGAEVVPIELVVGLGTFRPMSVVRVEDHDMHRERYAISPEAWATIRSARRVVAVGTTSVRALESAARSGELEGSTDIFIRRPFDWRVVDVLMTNFHLPRSSLLVLVDAFYGPGWSDLYAHALAAGYRFLSFGDAMLVARNQRLGDGTT